MRDLLVDALVAQSKGSNNCEQDMDEVIFGFDNRVESEGWHDIRPLIGQRESDTLKKTNNAILADIWGHITRTVQNKICNDCSEMLTADATSDQDFLKWIDLKQNDSAPEGKGLIRPTKNPVDSLISIEGIYNSCVDQCISTYSCNLKERLSSLMLEHSQACAFHCPVNVVI